MCKQRRRPGEGGDLMVHDGRGLGMASCDDGAGGILGIPKNL